jgi:hypothetical protein
MTVENLLQPRYKVIAPYPESPFMVGDIIKNEQWLGGFKFKDFPNIFFKMHWSSERHKDELPKHVGWFQGGEFTWVAPVVKWVNTDNRNEPLECIISFTNLDGEYEERSTNQFSLTPATEDQYNSFIQNQSK